MTSKKKGSSKEDKANRERVEYLDQLIKSVWDLIFVSEEIVIDCYGQACEIDVAKIIGGAVDRIKNFIPTTCISFYQINQESHEFEQLIVAPEAYSHNLRVEVDLSIEKGYFGWGIRQTGMSFFKPSFMSPEEVKTIFMIPMRSGMNLMGALLIFSPVEAEKLNQEMSRLLELVCRQISFTIENVKLYNKLKREHEKLEKAYKRIDQQMHQLSIFYDVGNALSVVDDLTKLLMHILEHACEIVDSQESILMLYEQNTEELVVRMIKESQGIHEERMMQEDVRALRFKKGEGIPGKVFETNRPMIIESGDVTDDIRSSVPWDFHNMLCIPINLNTDCVGTISFTNKKDGKKYTQDDMKSMMAIASQIAVAIKNARLYDLAVTDGLTKLYRRTYFMARLSEEIHRSMRYTHNLSLIMIDIDNFKFFNDRFGHQAGDVILMEIAKIFKIVTRVTDIIGRYGGEEFCILLPETSHKGALTVANRLRMVIENNESLHKGTRLRATISAGVATFPHHADSMECLVRAADMALYRAKELGKNRICSAEELETRASCQ